MVEKLCICIDVPYVGKSLEYIVPSVMSAGKATKLICTTLSDEYGTTFDCDSVMLVDTRDNTVLIKDCSMRQLGVTSGTRLLLI